MDSAYTVYTVMAAKRREKDLPQYVLAKLAETNQPNISWLERGLGEPSPELRIALAGILEVDPEDLLKPYESYILEQARSSN